MLALWASGLRPAVTLFAGMVHRMAGELFGRSTRKAISPFPANCLSKFAATNPEQIFDVHVHFSNPLNCQIASGSIPFDV